MENHNRPFTLSGKIYRRPNKYKNKACFPLATINHYNSLAFLLILLLTTPVIPRAYSQKQNEPLKLTKGTKQIENRLELFLSEKLAQKVKKVTGNKTYLKAQRVIWNGDSTQAKEIHTRGHTSLYYPRKSFSLTFNKKISIRNGDVSQKMKHVYALSLVMDKNYLSNRFAFGLLSKIELSGLFYAYGEVQINNKTEGIYLFIERPQDWALKKENSPFVIRRGYDQKISKLNSTRGLEKSVKNKYKKAFEKIYVAISRMQGEALYNELSIYIDLEMYMRWLAFNYFLSNGDYTDEVYFYIDPEEERFKIIPWDYDDIFAMTPHEGDEQRAAVFNNKLIFSSEDLLDKKIGLDEYLYDLYLDELKNVLVLLQPEIIKRELEAIYSELYPYYTNKEIISLSKDNYYKNADLKNLELDIYVLYQKLITLRTRLLAGDAHQVNK